jgi:hypothetical protein
MRARKQWFIVAMLTSVPFAASGDEMPRASKTANVLRGAEALQFLVGKTLRSVGGSKSGPTYRYFMNDHLEYRCLGIEPARLGRRHTRINDEANGCDVLAISMKGQRLCEASWYEECGQHDFTYTFRKIPKSTTSSGRQLLGKVLLTHADPTPAGSNFNNPTEYDLFQGNVTIFPDFDPSPRPGLLDSIERGEMGFEQRRCASGMPLGETEVAPKIVGNTLVSREPGGTFDGRRAEYFDPNGQIIAIAIPEILPFYANPLRPSQDSAGGIFINHWKIEKGQLCRTENDDPAKFYCGGLSVWVPKPKISSDASQPRWCVTASQTQTKYIVEGNPYRIEFKLPAVK